MRQVCKDWRHLSIQFLHNTSSYFVIKTNNWLIHSKFTGHFTSPSDLNLVLAKVNQVEILVVTPEGLRPVKQFTINGRVQVSNALIHMPIKIFQCHVYNVNRGTLDKNPN